jgi:DNA repair protein RadC
MKFTTKETILTDYRTLDVEDELFDSNGKLLVNEPKVVYNFLTKTFNLNNSTKEKFFVLALNSKLFLIDVAELSIGSVNQTIAQPRDIFQFLLLANATSFMVAHNHPSGLCSPSSQDNDLTDIIKEGAKYLGIKFNDHIIIGNDEFYSYSKSNRIIA